jgi:cell division protein FtsA
VYPSKTWPTATTNRSTAQSTAPAIGLLLRGLQEVELQPAPDNQPIDRSAISGRLTASPPMFRKKKKPSWFDSVFRKTKEWFEAEPDMDFNKK